MAIAILYREELREYDFGPGHPFRGDRYEIFPQFLKERVPEDDNYHFIKAPHATEEDLLLICSQAYIDFTHSYFKAAHAGNLDHIKFGLYQGQIQEGGFYRRRYAPCQVCLRRGILPV